MAAGDQPVEDILASIRKAIAEEAPAAMPAAAAAHSGSEVPLHVAAAAAGEEDVLELSAPLPPAPSPAPGNRPRPGLAAPETLDAGRASLAALSHLRLKGGDPADETLAGLVRELLRPMLKAWLDAELPAIVERMVVQEIARLTAPRD